jgi:hypothetical protein
LVVCLGGLVFFEHYSASPFFATSPASVHCLHLLNTRNSQHHSEYDQ